METWTLPELVIAAQHGDTYAFADLVRRFEGMALRLGLAMLGDRARAEDAAQEAFLDAYLSLRNLREPAAFPGWFRRIVFKHCDRQFRRDHGEVPLAEGMHYADGSADMLDTFMVRTRLHTALATLTERQQMLVRLFYIEGYSQAEIVRMLGWPLPTVKKQLFIARHQLREEIFDMTTTPETTGSAPTTTQRVEFFLALQTRNIARVKQLALEFPLLLTLFTEWAELENRNYWPLGYTALHYAAGIGDLDLIDALISVGADLNALSKQRFATPLHVAVQQQYSEVVPRLLAAGANVGAANFNGQSALHFAAYRGNEAITQALLAAGSAASLKDAGGRTPLDWAIYRNNTRVVEQLRHAGATTARPPQPVAIPAPDRSSAILETGIKLVDLFAPLARGAVNALFTPLSGVGKVVVIEQIMETIARQYAGRSLFLGIESGQYTGADFAIELNDVGLQADVDLFFVPANQQQAMIDTVTMALRQIDRSRETLLAIDARFAEVGNLQAIVEGVATGSTTVLWYGDYTAGIEPERFASARSVIGFEYWRALNGYWPSIDPLRSHSALLSGQQAQLVRDAQRLLRRYEDLRFIVERDPRGMEVLATDEDRVVVTRARKLHAFLSQPFMITELWTNTYGEYVPLAWALAGLEAVLAGKVDDIDEAQLRLIAGTQRKIRS